MYILVIEYIVCIKGIAMYKRELSRGKQEMERKENVCIIYTIFTIKCSLTIHIPTLPSVEYLGTY